MDFRRTFITNLQPTVAIQPSVCPLDHPPMPPESLARFDAFACNPRCNPTLPERLTFFARVIGFVGMQLRGPLARPADRTLDGADSIDGFFHHLDVVNIRRRDRHCQRNAKSFDHQMALRALFAAIRRILSGFIAPFCAGTADESRAARDQSMRSASPSRSSSTRCSFFQTPASCHSLSLRQQVMPEPQPISGGRYSHGNPVASTKRMPRSTSRFGMRGRPPRRFSGSGGSNGSITAHSSSVINCFAMQNSLHGLLRFC